MEVPVQICVLVLQDGLFEKQLSASGNNRQLVLHMEAHQVADAQEYLILGAHLCAPEEEEEAEAELIDLTMAFVQFSRLRQTHN